MTAGLENLNTHQIESDAAALVKSGTDNMTKWSDEKRKDFCVTFEARSRASAYILFETADKLIETAVRRQFVGEKASQKLKAAFPNRKVARDGGNYCGPVGGREVEELDAIAEKRAEEIFQNLPPLKAAVSLIKPAVAKKLDELDTLKAVVKKLADELDQPKYNDSIRLSQVDQKMTIADFRKMVKDRQKARHKLVERLNEKAQAACELEDEIARELFAGIPEVQDAILDVAKRHYERGLGMSSLNRRVEEYVKFGDSEAATEMVRQFERDEQATSPAIKAEFDKALEKLKLTAPMVRKQLAAKKKEARA